ncbi:hypothetical protein BKA93DRAFT_827939 [Sparassis latifolia]
MGPFQTGKQLKNEACADANVGLNTALTRATRTHRWFIDVTRLGREQANVATYPLARYARGLWRSPGSQNGARARQTLESGVVCPGEARGTPTARDAGPVPAPPPRITVDTPTVADSARRSQRLCSAVIAATAHRDMTDLPVISPSRFAITAGPAQYPVPSPVGLGDRAVSTPYHAAAHAPLRIVGQTNVTAKRDMTDTSRHSRRLITSRDDV